MAAFQLRCVPLGRQRRCSRARRTVANSHKGSSHRPRATAIRFGHVPPARQPGRRCLPRARRQRPPSRGLLARRKTRENSSEISPEIPPETSRKSRRSRARHRGLVASVKRAHPPKKDSRQTLSSPRPRDLRARRLRHPSTTPALHPRAPGSPAATASPSVDTPSVRRRPHGRVRRHVTAAVTGRAPLTAPARARRASAVPRDATLPMCAAAASPASAVSAAPAHRPAAARGRAAAAARGRATAPAPVDTAPGPAAAAAAAASSGGGAVTTTGGRVAA